MSTENIHILRHEIHSSFNKEDFTSNVLSQRIADLFDDYATGDSQNYHMYMQCMQEYNKKLKMLGLDSKIVQPTDAGFRPLDFGAFFTDVQTSGLFDFIQMEDDFFLLQEDSTKIVLEQDI